MRDHGGTKCTRCGGPSTTFACTRCTNQLRDLLADLPWWLNELEFTTTGQSRTGDPLLRTPRYRKPLNGDLSPWAVYPKDSYQSDAHARQDRKQAVLRDALARGRVDARASELLVQVRAALTEWIRDICETRGVALDGIHNTTADLARWLHRNVSSLANDPGFGVAYLEIAEIRRDIERVIDKPRPPHEFGPCPEMVAAGHDDECKEPKHPHQCDTVLRGNKRAAEVKCESCGTTHSTEGLFERQAAFAGGNSYTLSELDGAVLPALREYIPLRTMQHWAATGKLNPTGWTSKGDPKFLLDDVRQLWATKPQTRKTGASAHRPKPEPAC